MIQVVLEDPEQQFPPHWTYKGNYSTAAKCWMFTECGASFVCSSEDECPQTDDDLQSFGQFTGKIEKYLKSRGTAFRAIISREQNSSSKLGSQDRKYLNTIRDYPALLQAVSQTAGNTRKRGSVSEMAHWRNLFHILEIDHHRGFCAACQAAGHGDGDGQRQPCQTQRGPLLYQIQKQTEVLLQRVASAHQARVHKAYVKVWTKAKDYHLTYHKANRAAADAIHSGCITWKHLVPLLKQGLIMLGISRAKWFHQKEATLPGLTLNPLFFDIGAGCGGTALAAIQTGFRELFLLDFNKTAITLAARLVEHNLPLTGSAKVVEADAFTLTAADLTRDRPFLLFLYLSTMPRVRSIAPD
jgi:hypothetical protein